jgi:hypothetical protein
MIEQHYLIPNANATVPVRNAYTNIPTAVCVPSDINTNCGGGGSGTVTSVSMTGDGVIFNISVTGSPITTSGTLVPVLLTQTKNLFLGGPSSGSSATPTFRAIVGADLPNPSATTLGGIESLASTSHQWINAISTSGVPSATQPNYTDLSGTVPALTALTGDASASGSGSQVITLSTVNSNIGTFQGITVNAKGLVTAALNQSYLTGNQTITLSGDTTGSGTTAITTSTVKVNGGAIPASATVIGTNSSSQLIDNSSATISNNTSGTASNLSGTPALPNGTTATTQSSSDNSTKISTTAYVTTAVNNAIAGVNPAVAVQAGTTSASDTFGFTYNNGVNGVGATFTGSTNTAVTIDGYTFTTPGQRLLVKNDTQTPSGAFNGIYYVTQIQTSLLPPIFTRALDYDQPSDMNNTGAIPIINGTVNGSTSWILTSQISMVGTSPLTYTQFTLNPSNIVTTVTSVGGIYDPTITPNTGSVTVAQKAYTQTLLAIAAANDGGGV